MGFVEKVKNVISKLRAEGKTEKEVSEIIKQAAEAATVLKKTFFTFSTNPMSPSSSAPN